MVKPAFRPALPYMWAVGALVTAWSTALVSELEGARQIASGSRRGLCREKREKD